MSFSGRRVYFAANGIGLGHVSRDAPVASAVVKEGGEVLFSTFLDGVDYVRRQGFGVVSAPPLTLANDAQGGIDLKLSGVTTGATASWTFLSQVRFELESMKAFRPDAVLSDSRLSAIYAAKLLEIPVISLINQFAPIVPRVRDNEGYRFSDASIMTVLGWMWTWSEYVLIPDFPAPYTLSVDTLRIPSPYMEKVRFIGAILPVKPEQCPEPSKTREAFGVAPDQKLVFAGISGPRAERIPLLRILEPIFEGFPDDIRVLMSTGDPSGGSDLTTSRSLIKVPWLEDRFAVLHACDAVVSRGGHETIMQSICYRKPALVIPVPGHPEQYGNARAAERLGVADAIHQADVTPGYVLEHLLGFLGDPSYARSLSEMSAHASLGDGVGECLRVLESVIRR